MPFPAEATRPATWCSHLTTRRCSSASGHDPTSTTLTRRRLKRIEPQSSSSTWTEPAGAFTPAGFETPRAINPTTRQLWVCTNERDNLGDNLVPDYVTHVEDGGFYGWPWYYLGGNQDPRLEGKHPELKATVKVPDVLLQPHSAPLNFVFYGGQQFAPEHRTSVFLTAHGSWNKAVRTGYKVVRVPLTAGAPTGEYEDFVTGFVTADGQVWGRPVGVAVASGGSLMVSDDGSNSIWQVSYTGKK